MIQRFLKFPIRKDILKNNKPINHSQLLTSMPFTKKVPFLLKYHKKKTVAFCLALVIIYTYDLQKRTINLNSAIMRKIVSMRSPVQFIQSLFVEQKKIPNTILQQNYNGIDLSKQTLNLLISLYVEADKYLYFGVGRYYLFQIYNQLGTIQKEQEITKFWMASGFYKQRNQKASGVSLTQFLTIFEQGLQYAKKKDPNINEKTFLKMFVEQFIKKAPEVVAWQQNFNRERTKEFLKNMPGQNDKKKDAIIEILKESSQTSNLLTEEQLEVKIKEMGLKGLNLTDKMLYWELKRVWDSVKIVSIQKKISHPLTTELEKSKLHTEKTKLENLVLKSEDMIKEIETNFQNLYQQSIF